MKKNMIWLVRQHRILKIQYTPIRKRLHGVPHLG